ncbi:MULTISPECIES: VCBS domain-containing protein [unclassified Bradyrhizobium]|uniref:VCBS domain-containing protein n=1 Tax=unclassified Bradyrhizobium TaxID=2631580 RepID=UPI0033967FAD
MPDGAFVVPDPNLIFNGDFKRAGLDLVLSHDGHDFVVHDYFRGDKRAAIASPDGAHLTGDVVNALTGHVQYAQTASGIAAAQVIGHVTKLSGSATAVRNGVSVILNNGDNVEKGDVVSTGGDSTLGITFIDGTVFGLSSNARMVLNEMVYDPNGSSNSSLLSLVAGTITFVAGETAKHGDMKIDTPVATMGIRGTAVLTQINFVVPAGGGDPQPQASFQVLVEPNGTTGSYILFDKVTLLPIATVNQAGQMIQISGGNVSISNALMSPDIQKLITDVFTLKFTDNNSNTKLTQNFTDSITQTGNIVFIKTDTGATATATFTHLPEPTSQGSGHDPSTSTRIPGPPLARSLDLNGNVKKAFELTEHANATGDRADASGDTVGPDEIIFRITFVDQNLGDRPTVSIDLGDAPNYVYKNAGQQDVTGTLSALQKQDIAATQAQISVAAAAGNNNNGSADLTYRIPDHVFDFLAAGETLTLTYKVRVNNNFSVNPETSTIDITITITGTNDKPVITSSVPVIIFEGGTSVPGGPLTSDVPTTGTLSFDDVDLTDKHTVSVALTSATLPDGTVPPGPLAAFQSAMSVAIAAGADSTGDGTGTINWSLADLPVYLADFIPKGEVLTLVYTVTLKDAQGATSQQTITVTITGTDAPAVVWIATDKPGAPSGGFWKDAANWATGTVPTINDDVIVITDQLHGLTPSYPVTIDTAAYAKSITMNDYDTTVGHTAPEVINKSALTIAGEVSLKADSKLTNFAASTISVGGKAEFLDSSVLTNAGYLTLKGGGDFASGTTITNSGTIELFGGTLTTLATIHNAGGTLKADAGTTLIVDSATVDGGTVTILGTLELDGTSLIENGTLNNSGAVNVKGTAEFAHETVSNASGGTIKVLANGWLTIDQGSTVANSGNVTVDATGKLTVNGATISGGTIDGLGTIDVTGASTIDGGSTLSTATVTANAKLTLDGITVSGSTITDNAGIELDNTVKLKDGASIQGGAVANIGTLKIAGAATLLNDVVTNTGTLTVDGGQTLKLSGTEISGGAVNGAGTIDVLGASKIDGGATLSTATVSADAKLTLDGITVSGSTITDNAGIELDNTVKLKDGASIQGGAVANTGTLKIAGAATLLNDVVTNTGTVTVDGGQTLKLSGTEISGGAVNGAGTIDVIGASKIDGGATLSTATVSADAKLTLDGITVSGSTITNNAGIELDNTVKLKDGASIQGGAVANTGTLKIAGAATLLNDVVTNTGTVTVDAGQTLTLSGTEISGGTVNGAGTIDVTGASKIDQSATLSATAVTVESGVILTLDDVTVAGTAIANHGTVKVDASSKLTLNGASLTGGTLNVSGTLNSTGATSITDANISNDYLIEATLGALTLLATTSATSIANGGILRANGAELDINGEVIANTGTLAAIDHGTLKLIGMTVTNIGSGSVSVESNSTLDLQGATIDGGTVTIAGTLKSTGTSAVNNADITNTGTITVTSGTLMIDPATLHAITNHNLIQANGGVLDVSGEDIANTAALEAVNHGTLKLANLTVSNTSAGSITVDGTSKLFLTDVSINGGSLSNAGNLYSAGVDTVTGSVTNTGIIEVQSGTLDLAGGIAGSGQVIVDVGATLEFSGATGSIHIVNSGSIVGAGSNAAIHVQQDTTGSVIDNSGTIGPAAASSVTSATDAIVEIGGSITINNTGHINGNISVATATFNNESGGTWTVAGTSVFGNASTILNDGVIDLLNGASISLSGPGLVNHNHIDSWGTASISGTISNTGSIEVHDGELSLFGSLTGTGSVTVDAGALLKLEGTVAQTINLAGNGAALEIDTDTFGGSIAELSANDTIDLSMIKYGLGTSAVYVANSNPATGGVLTVTDADGNHISLDLAGADYSNAHFAGSDVGTGHTLITMTDDHAPAFTAGGVLAGGVSEQADATGDFATSDTSTPATGAIDFTDIDLTDLPTAQITGRAVTSLGADHITNLTCSLTPDDIAALKSGLTLLPQAGLNNGTVTWSYSIADGALDFLAKDQTAKVVSTITITDDYGETATTDVTITVTGRNDAPTLAAVTTDPLVDTAIADSFSDITGTLVGTDADHGETAGLTYAVLNADSHGTTAGLYGSLTVNENGTYTYVPDAASINALSEGNHIDTFTVQTTDAQGAVGTATFEVNVTGANDAPVITAASGDSAVATVSETDAGLDKTGTLTLSDLDTADHVSVARNDHVDVYLQGDLKADGFEGLWASDLLNYFTVPSGEILNGTANHAQFTWEFNSGSHAFDFLAAGQTLSLQYTIVPSDGHTATGTGNGVVTININGTNDAPTLDSTTLASVTGNESNPGGATIVSLFTDKFHDVDTGASFTAVAVTSDTASAAQGIWQYELHGTDQWVDIGLVSDTSALVLSTDTLIRFVPADGFTGTPDALGVHALDDTYTGAITDSSSPAIIDLTATGTGGTTPVSHDLTTIDTEVTAPPAYGPVINTDHFQVSHSNELNTDSITRLSVVDTDSGAATDDFKMTAVTGHDPDSSVDPGTACGNLDDINSALADGVTYSPGASPPDTDQITLTVTDKTTGLFDTVHFIFNEAGDTSQGVSLQGTSGKDVIFGTDTNDTLTGGDSKDQFVFAPGVLYDDNGQPLTDFSHTITDFTEGLDKIDLRQFSSVSSTNNLTIVQQQDSDDTLVTWQQQVNPLEGAPITEHEALLLKNVIAASLKGSDFIFHIT